MKYAAQPAALLLRGLFMALIALACFFIVKALMTWFNPSTAWVAPQASASTQAAPVQSQAPRQYDLSFDPFHRDTPNIEPPTQERQQDEDAPDTTLNLTLKGFIAPDRATIQGADRNQKSYGLGDEVTSGVTLESVNPEGEYVILSRDGARERLSIERASEIQNQPGRASGGRATPVLTAVGGNPMEILNAMSFEPVKNGNRLTGYKISESAGVDLKQLGFRNGDVLTRVGAQDLTNPNVNVKQAIMQAALSGKTTAQIMRRGRKMTIRVKLP